MAECITVSTIFWGSRELNREKADIKTVLSVLHNSLCNLSREKLSPQGAGKVTLFTVESAGDVLVLMGHREEDGDIASCSLVFRPSGSTQGQTIISKEHGVQAEGIYSPCVWRIYKLLDRFLEKLLKVRPETLIEIKHFVDAASRAGTYLDA